MESGIAAASRAEKGNEKYDYFYSPDNKNELLLIELWASEEVLKQHWETDHFKALGELKKEYVADTVISRYEVE
jgi:quinol monooxygenase YgiN